jgi:hypothetical protein
MTVPGGRKVKWRKTLEWALRRSVTEVHLFVDEETNKNKEGTRGALVIKAANQESATGVLQLIRRNINP